MKKYSIEIKKKGDIKSINISLKEGIMKSLGKVIFP